MSWTDFGYPPTTTRWTTLDQSDTDSGTITNGDGHVRGVLFACSHNGQSGDDAGASLSIKKQSGASTQPMTASRKFTFSTDNMSPALWLRCFPDSSSSVDNFLFGFLAVLIAALCFGVRVLADEFFKRKRRRKEQLYLEQLRQTTNWRVADTDLAPQPQPPLPPPPDDQVFNARTPAPAVHSPQPLAGTQQPLTCARQESLLVAL